MRVATNLIFFMICVITCLQVNATANDKLVPSLMADVIQISEDGNTIHASGDVQITFGDQTLKALSVKYSKLTNKIEAGGPLTLSQGTKTIFFAKEAILYSDLKNLTLTQAKFILENSLEVYSKNIRRVDGKFTNFYETVASTCKVCNENDIPLWQIKAKKITHNSSSKQIYFYNAKFIFSGVPLAYLPLLRVPDPSVKRFNGFLTPELNYSNNIGSNITLPYFITLGKHSDVTLEPTINTKNNNSFGLKYRHLFKLSDLNLKIFLINEGTSQKKLNGYLFANYDQRTGKNSHLKFQFQRTSNLNLLSRQKESNLKFTESYLNFGKQSKSVYSELGLYHSNYQNPIISYENMPSLNHNTNLNYVFKPRKIGGQANLLLKFDAYQRKSIENGNLGRDAITTVGNFLWKKNIIFASGFVADIRSLSTAKASKFYNDNNYRNTIYGINQITGIDFSLPLIKRETKATTIYEPKFQLVYSIPTDHIEPNEDSSSSEISTSNFNDLNRSYGSNRAEDGLRVKTSLKTTYRTAKNFQSDLFIGSSTNLNGMNEFTIGSGLSNKNTNYLGSIKLNFYDQMNLKTNLISDEAFRIIRNDVEINYNKNDMNIYSKFFYKKKDNLLGFKSDRSELNFGTNYKFNKKISTNLNLTYDMNNRHAQKTELTSRYHHNCMAVDFSVSRDFNHNVSINSGLLIGIKFELIGLRGSIEADKAIRCAS